LINPTSTADMTQSYSAPSAAIHGVMHQPPRKALPAGSCDCHTHVFGPNERYPLAADRQYTPGQARLEDMLRLHDQLGIDRVVIVHPSPYGSDNSCTVDALRLLGERGRGVAVIDEKTSDAQLQTMHDAGVRGVRVNLETDGINDPVLATRQLLWAHDRVKDLGWHVQIFTNLTVFASLEPALDQLSVPVVLDHFCRAPAALGPSQPHFGSLLQRVREGRVWVKLSAPQRISNAPDCADAEVMVQALIAANPDRLLWGSDWPHPGAAPGKPRQRDVLETFNPVDDGRALNRLAEWVNDSTILKKILVNNPAKLYDFKTT
jgi:predicted TIM-barrel fold metal-dependent hydrolase